APQGGEPADLHRARLHVIDGAGRDHLAEVERPGCVLASRGRHTGRTPQRRERGKILGRPDRLLSATSVASWPSASGDTQWSSAATVACQPPPEASPQPP